jgi:hypothetical protein
MCQSNVFGGRIELFYKQKLSKFSLDDPAEPRQESKS